jgi:hypothetical protein
LWFLHEFLDTFWLVIVIFVILHFIYALLLLNNFQNTVFDFENISLIAFACKTFYNESELALNSMKGKALRCFLQTGWNLGLDFVFLMLKVFTTQLIYVGRRDNNHKTHTHIFDLTEYDLWWAGESVNELDSVADS